LWVKVFLDISPGEPISRTIRRRNAVDEFSLGCSLGHGKANVEVRLEENTVSKEKSKKTDRPGRCIGWRAGDLIKGLSPFITSANQRMPLLVECGGASPSSEGGPVEAVRATKLPLYISAYP
jgi:hypothetical protein